MKVKLEVILTFIVTSTVVGVMAQDITSDYKIDTKRGPLHPNLRYFEQKLLDASFATLNNKKSYPQSLAKLLIFYLNTTKLHYIWLCGWIKDESASDYLADYFNSHKAIKDLLWADNYKLKQVVSLALYKRDCNTIHLNRLDIALQAIKTNKHLDRLAGDLVRAEKSKCTKEFPKEKSDNKVEIIYK